MIFLRIFPIPWDDSSPSFTHHLGEYHLPSIEKPYAILSRQATANRNSLMLNSPDLSSVICELDAATKTREPSLHRCPQFSPWVFLMRDINKTNNKLSIPMELPFFERKRLRRSKGNTALGHILCNGILRSIIPNKKTGGSRCHFPPASRFGVVLHKLLILGFPRYTAKNLCQTIPNS